MQPAAAQWCALRHLWGSSGWEAKGPSARSMCVQHMAAAAEPGSRRLSVPVQPAAACGQHCACGRAQARDMYSLQPRSSQLMCQLCFRLYNSCSYVGTCHEQVECQLHPAELLRRGCKEPSPDEEEAHLGRQQLRAAELRQAGLTGTAARPRSGPGWRQLTGPPLPWQALGPDPGRLPPRARPCAASTPAVSAQRCQLRCGEGVHRLDGPSPALTEPLARPKSTAAVGAALRCRQHPVPGDPSMTAIMFATHRGGRWQAVMLCPAPDTPAWRQGPGQRCWAGGQQLLAPAGRLPQPAASAPGVCPAGRWTSPVPADAGVKGLGFRVAGAASAARVACQASNWLCAVLQPAH